MKFFSFLSLLSIGCVMANASQRWSVEKAAKWQKEVGWKAGANFIPSNAVNELEMWQAETYDPVTINRELQFAENLGFNTIRVFLHNLLWSQDSKGFLKRLDNFLDMADKHHISVMFVLFDSCWLPNPKVGTQPPPTPGVHNSQWVQSPGFDIVSDATKFETMSEYVKGVVTHLKHDKRVLAWDIWNEPDNSGYSGETIGPLLQRVVDWMHEVDPIQPITTPIWVAVEVYDYSSFQQLQLNVSDVISFHNYNNASVFETCVQNLQKYAPKRPIICTEYMARPQDSHFEPHLGYMYEQNVMAINWGFVNGKTQTIYSWDTNTTPATEPPLVWFHDIVNPDETPFDQKEVDYIKSITKNIKK